MLLLMLMLMLRGQKLELNVVDNNRRSVTTSPTTLMEQQLKDDVDQRNDMPRDGYTYKGSSIIDVTTLGEMVKDFVTTVLKPKQ